MSTFAIQTERPEGNLRFRDQELVIDESGCLYWPDERILIVADLHLEKGSSLAARGIHVPPYDTEATLNRLAKRLDYWQPRMVIALGDSFHDEQASNRLPDQSRLTLMRLMSRREWIWISGNHDPTPPRSLGGSTSEHLQIGALNFRHEPLPRFVPGEVAGHLHPSAKIKHRGKNIRKRCVVGCGNRLILPAFGAYTGGLNACDPAFDDLFEPGNKKAWMLGRDGIFEICASRLAR